jgi:hypothetical protein
MVGDSGDTLACGTWSAGRTGSTPASTQAW